MLGQGVLPQDSLVAPRVKLEQFSSDLKHPCLHIYAKFLFSVICDCATCTRVHYVFSFSLYMTRCLEGVVPADKN